MNMKIEKKINFFIEFLFQFKSQAIAILVGFLVPSSKTNCIMFGNHYIIIEVIAQSFLFIPLCVCAYVGLFSLVLLALQAI